MRKILSAVLYTALLLGANTAVADIASIKELREGTIKKLVFSKKPKAVPQIIFTDPEGLEYQLADWEGKYVLLNFWATWCAPCRKEMPALEKLAAEFNGDNFEVVTIATTRNTLEGINKFFGEINVSELPILMDFDQDLSRKMTVFGLPTTILIDPDGFEIARTRGDADWYSDSARAVIAAVLEEAPLAADLGS